MKSIAALAALLSLATAQGNYGGSGGHGWGGGWGGGHGGGGWGGGGHGGGGHGGPPGGYGGGGHGGGPHGGGGNGKCVNRPAVNTPGEGGAVLTADEITALGNNSLFTRWRPYAHFNAPAGWMNDPCGPMYDPTRDIYHMFYQWHPLHINWGNISWGYATSKDLVTWTDHGGWQGREALALGPEGNGTYDGLGIFSGTAQPVNLEGEVDGTLLIFYTSVSYLPTGWRAYYEPYTETQSYALSHDGGNTWQRYEGNPVINATTNTAPMYWNVTGFRDPFFHPWTELDAVLDKSDPHFYAVMGSGIKGPNVQFGPGTATGFVGPRIPLWSAPSADLTDWTFEGALWEPAPNTTLGTYLSTGSYGYNFEVSGFFSLYDSQGNNHYYINMGTEGGNVSFHQNNHWALWNEGTVSRRANGSAMFTPIAGGAGDWGLGYAITSFNDTKNDRRIKWSWVPEDLTGAGGIFSATQQGFQGALAIPLEYFVHETPNVMKIASLLESKTVSFLADGTTATTLGQRIPADILGGLRSCARKATYKAGKLSASKALGKGNGAAYELGFTITNAYTGSVGARIQTSPDGTEFTTITYNPNNSTITVDRSSSSNIDGFANDTVTGYFAPYQIEGTGREPIVMSIFVDGSLVEVHANNRFMLSTRVYPAQTSATGFGLYVASGGSATFSNVYSYVGLSNVWPSRPQNSSSELVYDTPAETNDYIWWPGN